MKLTREAAMQARLASKDVLIPEWGMNGEPAEACIVELPAHEMIEFLEFIRKPENKPDGMFHTVIRTLRDRETREQILSHNDVEHFRKNGSFGVFSRLQDDALKLNYLHVESGEELKKLSGEGATAGSLSDSPSILNT
jgi:hypothetical protein